MASFTGSHKIILYEGDVGQSYQFEITKCSSLTANDGFLSFGTDATSVETFIYSSSDDSTALIDFSIIDSISQNIITLTLDYPSISGPGKYTIIFKLGLSNGSTKMARFDRLFAESLPGEH